MADMADPWSRLVGRGLRPLSRDGTVFSPLSLVDLDSNELVSLAK